MKQEPSMEHSPIGNSRKQDHDGDFNLREWSLKAKISRENTSSRRFSASYIRSFREDIANKSFRSNISISSTASSPGYTLREEIDPSTYSFTTAIKALQAKTTYSWEYMSPDGLALNSKWNEAEKYICNPLSGEVPLECLSAKTLSGRSFQRLSNRITMSAPLIYPPPQFQTKQFHPKPHLLIHEAEIQIPIKEKGNSITRDAGTQSSTPGHLSSKSPSPAHTPSIEERPTKRRDDSPLNTPEQTVEVKETRQEEDTKRNEESSGEISNNYKEVKEKKKNQSRCFLSWRGFHMRQRKRDKKHSCKNNIFPCHMNGC